MLLASPTDSEDERDSVTSRPSRGASHKGLALQTEGATAAGGPRHAAALDGLIAQDVEGTLELVDDVPTTGSYLHRGGGGEFDEAGGGAGQDNYDDDGIHFTDVDASPVKVTACARVEREGGVGKRGFWKVRWSERVCACAF